MSDELRFLIETVKEASNLITDEMIVNSKDDKGDLVTNFDYDIEQFIIKKINKYYPNFSIISEEYNTNNKITDNCFTIDPIDGTINFVNGLSLWAIQVACIKNSKTCASVIYIPKLNELFSADENGAYLNDEPIHVNNITDFNKGIFAYEGPADTLLQYRMSNKSRTSRDIHCAAIDFAYTAAGRFSAAIFAWKTIWDYVPGMYIVKQAGGVIYDDDNYHIAASNEKYLKELLNNLQNM